MDNFFAVLIVAVSFAGGVTVLVKTVIAACMYHRRAAREMKHIEIVLIEEVKKQDYTKLAPASPQSGLYRPYSWMDEEATMVEREYRCPYCEVEARTKPALYQHIEICHPGQRKRVTKPKK